MPASEWAPADIGPAVDAALLAEMKVGSKGLSEAYASCISAIGGAFRAIDKASKLCLRRANIFEHQDGIEIDISVPEPAFLALVKRGMRKRLLIGRGRRVIALNDFRAFAASP